jgi:hypothetical protein
VLWNSSSRSGWKDTAAGVGHSQTKLTTEAKQVETRSLKNGAAGGKTAVMKRARIDHADTESRGPHRRLAGQTQNKKREVLAKAAEHMMEKNIKQAYVEHGVKATSYQSESTISPNGEKHPPIWVVCIQTQLDAEVNQVKKQTENKLTIFFSFGSTSPSPSSSPYLPPRSPDPQHLTFV